MRLIRELADIASSTYPLAEHILKHNVYVDDVLFGSDNVSSLKLMRDEVNRVLTSSGFPLKKWISNSGDILEDFKRNRPDLLRETNSSSVFKVLGVTWNATIDNFELGMPKFDRAHMTKRAMLANIAKIFDPLGWLSPIVVRAKCLLQSLWLIKFDWDDILPDTIINQWLELIDDLDEIQWVTIPRWVGYDTTVVAVELVSFLDASTVAYSAAVYLRLIDAEGVKQSSLLMAKSKVAPLKVLSIPRLELCGAVLLTQLLKHVQSLLTVTVTHIHCFTDSKIVLAWLQKPSHSWTTFVANRIAMIQTELSTVSWHHVSSRHNPADLNSRGVSSRELNESMLWWYGPPWLKFLDFDIHDASSIPQTNLECKPHMITSWLINVESWSVLFLEQVSASDRNRVAIHRHR